MKQIGPIVDKKPVRRQLDWYEEEEIRTDPDLILIGQCEATIPSYGIRRQENQEIRTNKQWTGYLG